MTAADWEACYFGSSDAIRQQLAEGLGVTVHAGLPAAVDRVGCVILESGFAGPALADLGADNPFAACRRIKDGPRWRVFFLVPTGDAITPEIARFCLSDGAFEFDPDGDAAVLAGSVQQIRERLAPHRPRVSMESLLSRLESEIASDEGRQASALQRMLAAESGQTLLDQLVDQETGLFDGPFASFKLDEEFKRSLRFHQPLSLLLLDIGVDLGAMESDGRLDYLAQVASVFLNECRDIDIIGRFTESTFMVLMPGTGSAGAEVLARRMLAEVRDRSVVEGAGGSPTAGLATMPAAGIHNRQAFLARAEACLQLARSGQGEAGFCAYSE